MISPIDRFAAEVQKNGSVFCNWQVFEFQVSHWQEPSSDPIDCEILTTSRLASRKILSFHLSSGHEKYFCSHTDLLPRIFSISEAQL